MRIAFVVPRFLPHAGGVEMHVARLAGYLLAHGDQVEVLAPETDPGLPRLAHADGIPVRRFPTVGSARDYAVAPGLWRHLARARGRYDVVHAHSYHATAALAAARLATGPLVFTPHYLGTGHTRLLSALHRLYRPTGATVFARADAVICVSRDEAALLRERFPQTAGKTRVIPNGVDTAALRSAEPFRADHPLIVTSNRLERYKNTHRVVDALAHLDPAVRLVVLGAGPQRHVLAAQAVRLGVADRVRLLGRAPAADVRSWLATADAVACLSERECFGMVVLEACTAGAPVLASDIAVHRELAEYLPAGGLRLVPPGAATEQIAAALDATLRSGRVRAVRAPDWTVVAARTRQLYADLCGKADPLRPPDARLPL